MLLDLLVFAACAAIGVQVQRRRPDADRLRSLLWRGNFALLLPLAATYAFLSIDLDAQLLAVVACGVTAWWSTVLVAGAYARVVAPTRQVRGALWLVGALPNTGFVGFPLALLAFGHDGLRMAIIYDQVSLVVPMVVVATVIARHHAAEPAATSAVDRSVMREALTSPPLLTVLVLVSLRLTVLREPIEVELLGRMIGIVVGPVGFLLLGMSLPLGGFVHRRREVLATIGAMLVRVVIAPAMVWVVSSIAGIEVPQVLYLLAALPTAFAALVVARLHDLEVEVVRLGLLGSTTVVMGATLAWVAWIGGGAG